MQKLLINYADQGFIRAQQENARSALTIGGFDQVICYGRHDLDLYFRWRNRRLLSESRGAGYWLWKPYITLRTLRQRLRDGDILAYCDSDARFVSCIDPLVQICLSQSEPRIVVFTRRRTHQPCLD